MITKYLSNISHFFFAYLYGCIKSNKIFKTHKKFYQSFNITKNLFSSKPTGENNNQNKY